MTHHHPNLYCSEEHIHWGEEKQVEDEHTATTTTTNSSRSHVVLLEHDLFWDHQELPSLLAKEQEQEQEHHHNLSNSLQDNPVLASSRREAVEWLLKVNAHYSFSTLTAVLALNYLDRFLSSFTFQNDKPWLMQLAAVACLSLAAKVEETHVPLYVDLQLQVRVVKVGGSRYLFDGKTIKRMEMLVLSTLGWKMNPVTPLSFLDYITRKLGLKGYLCLEFLRRCETILLSVFADARFMGYLPSVLAMATMMRVVNIVEPRLGVEYQDQLLGILGIDKEKVEECYKLTLEVVSGYDERSNLKKRKFVESNPCSSCDSSSDSWELGASVPSSKKSRTQEQLLLNHSNFDFLSIHYSRP